MMSIRVVGIWLLTILTVGFLVVRPLIRRGQTATINTEESVSFSDNRATLDNQVGGITTPDNPPLQTPLEVELHTSYQDDVLASTDYTEKTIALFEKNPEHRLITTYKHPYTMIVKNQPRKIKVYLYRLQVNDIPETIDPFQATDLYILGWGLENHGSNTQKVAEKFFRALRDVRVENLYLSEFNIAQGVLSSVGTPIPLTLNSLVITRVEYFFLAWVCESVDLSARTEGFKLSITNSNTHSIACLSQLGVKRLSFFFIRGLPHLESFDYLLPNTEAAGGTLSMFSLSEPFNVSKAVAKSIANTKWDKIRLDMHIWNSICFAAGKGINVVDVLGLNALHPRDLDRNKTKWGRVPFGATSLCIESRTGLDKNFRELFDLVMYWVSVCGGSETKYIKILQGSNLKIIQDIGGIGRWIGKGKWGDTLSQKTLWINSKHVPIVYPEALIPG
ncbi:hypothetical protein NEDG_02035 [Nematocida displodere]|uniref:Uncharacterized protein n=1 Tax=Nematocida displodere TaxID=1805483 RepID=A0A177EJW8_9MICR|nr:hypothetical protein NEDG_02035 [Nematocida displodere]